MKFLLTLTGFILSFLIYGFYLAQYELNSVPAVLKKDNPVGFYDYRGVTNVQTDLSLGSSPSMEVISEAKKAGLDFLIITDVNQFEQIENYNAYNGNLLVFSGGEFSYLDARLLFYSAGKEGFPQSSSDSNVFFTDFLTQQSNQNRQSFVVLAHPFRNGPTWTGPYPAGLDGLEVLNTKSVSSRAWTNSKFNVVWSAITYPFNPQLSFLRLFREPTEETALWDKLASSRKTLGFAGADASARAIPWSNYSLKFPSYQRSFEIVSNHVLLEAELTGQYQKDRQKIFNALRMGQFYFAVDLLGDPKGFNAVILDQDKVHPIGSKLKFNKNLKLSVKIPNEPKDFYEVVIIKNGEGDMLSNEQNVVYDIKSPGQYRVAVRISVEFPFPEGRRWVTWIYTNHFYVTP